MATQAEREAFLSGWRAAMDEVLAVLANEARDWAQEESDAEAAGEFKLPGSFALEEVRGSFKGRHELLVWISEIGPAAPNRGNPAVKAALEALVESRASNDDRVTLGLAPLGANEARTIKPDDGAPSQG